VKSTQQMEDYFNQVILLLGTPDLKYISFRVDEPKKVHRALYKRLQTHFRKADMGVPVKIIKDGNMLWIIKR
jgi:hypothetical protein